MLLIGEEKRGYLSPKQYSGLSMAEVSEVIDQISQIHAVSTAMFLSNDLSLTESVSSLERIGKNWEEAGLKKIWPVCSIHTSKLFLERGSAGSNGLPK